MRLITPLLLGLAALVAPGCVATEESGWMLSGSGPRLMTVSVYDDTVPWPRTGEYDWLGAPAIPADPELEGMDVNPMIRSSLAAAYQRRGFDLGTAPDVGFYVAYRLVGKDSLSDAIIDAQYPVAPKGRWLPSRNRPQNYAPGSLVVDIVCAIDNCPRWRGSVSTGLYEEGDTEDHQRWLDSAARLLLRTFPPPGVEFVP